MLILQQTGRFFVVVVTIERGQAVSEAGVLTVQGAVSSFLTSLFLLCAFDVTSHYFAGKVWRKTTPF